MASGDGMKDNCLESDSDDEFFDALASDNKVYEGLQDGDMDSGQLEGKNSGLTVKNKGVGETEMLPSPDISESAETVTALDTHLISDCSKQLCSETAQSDGRRWNRTEDLSGEVQGHLEAGESAEISNMERTQPHNGGLSDEPTGDGGQAASGTLDSNHTADEIKPHEEQKHSTVVKQDSTDGIADEEEIRRMTESAMTEKEREKLRDEAQNHKNRGNNLFKQNEFLDAIAAYTEALDICPLCYKKERSIMYANRAACRVRREQFEEAVKDCDKALKLHPHYLKVWLRRANTYEAMDKLDEALADFQKVLELDPSCYEARAACMRLPEQIKERNEKLKEEMFGKLKELGNMVLKPFGLSTNNFQLQQDPSTGSYSVNFNQNPGNGN